ncbi:thioesterase family protein [Marinobacter lacisalsi]|uniref:Thioesterase family protein n=1 Tax=Marinobacter lacisalsi TaxID=475979 RepID=A0ABV8QM19_9GAMM
MTTQNNNPAVFHGTITPRYTDLDTWRHVNNSRVYQLHIEARIQALVDRFGPDAWFSDAERLRPVRTITHFRQVSWFGSNIDFTVELLGCDDHHARLRSELYQDGKHVGTQECLLGALLNHEWVPLPATIRDSFRKDVPRDPEPLPEEHYSEKAGNFEHFPFRRELTPRYADLDADSQSSEAAIARYMEQARFGSVRSIDLKELGILIASLDITFGHYRPSGKPVELASGVTHLGNTSFHLTGGARSVHGLHAVANSVMVIVDLDENRPTPLTDDLRSQLEKLKV